MMESPGVKIRKADDYPGIEKDYLVTSEDDVICAADVVVIDGKPYPVEDEFTAGLAYEVVHDTESDSLSVLFSKTTDTVAFIGFTRSNAYWEEQFA